MPPDDEPKVKDLLVGRVPLDPATQADLARWFDLPSVTQLEDEGKQAGPDDAQMAEVLERRARALESIDPVLLAEIAQRTEDRPVPIVFKPTLELVIDENTAFFDHGMLDRVLTIADPREVEIPDALLEDLRDCTPQALLRDLHRPELFFDKTFEVVDAAAEQRLDIVAEVKAAMAASWRLPDFGRSDIAQSREMIESVRAQRRQPWIDFLPLLPNRTVHE